MTSTTIELPTSTAGLAMYLIESPQQQLNVTRFVVDISVEPTDHVATKLASEHA